MWFLVMVIIMDNGMQCWLLLATKQTTAAHPHLAFESCCSELTLTIGCFQIIS
jgi:hypothetical protein